MTTDERPALLSILEALDDAGRVVVLADAIARAGGQRRAALVDELGRIAGPGRVRWENAVERLADLAGVPHRPAGVALELLTEQNPLAALAATQTPAARRFFAALTDCHAAAAALDKERGDVGSDGAPCGWGELLGLTLARARSELIGQQKEGP
jgi:hypothetical protein